MSDASYRIVLNKQNWNGQATHLRSTLMTWDWRWRQAAAGAILDFSNVEFMEPWALAMFCAFGSKLRADGAAVVVELDPTNPCNKYLEAMGLREVIERGASSDRWDESTQNTGLHVLRRHSDVTRFVDSAARLGLPAESGALDALQYGMAELGRNVIQHANSAIGGIAIAQRFPELHAVQIAICDCGRGVRQSLKQNYPEVSSDLEALRVAVLPHVSGAAPSGPYGSSVNAGLGLFFCREISHRAGGSFWIASQGGLLGVIGDESATGRRMYRRINAWDGTLVVMHFPEDLVVEFDDVLGVCRELAALARSEPSRVGLEFIDDHSDIEIEQADVIDVSSFLEDVEKAEQTRSLHIMPRLEAGRQTIIDFGQPRFVTQSFVHALLYAAFLVPGSLSKLMFKGCTKSTQEAIRLVAAYSKVNYRQAPL
ncbi:MAG: sensor histidine kinase [Phycisphaerales bacterium]|nr:sensor histidine kinase [Phycisphaerales bacterium]